MDQGIFTHEELKRRVIEGFNDFPTTPGLAEAAMEVIAPHLTGIVGKDIVYSCRWPYILRVQELDMNEEGFRALATLERVIPLDDRNLGLRSPFRFGAVWGGLNMCGAAVSMKMLVDFFITDPLIVEKVKEAADDPDSASKVRRILMEAMERKK
jgi:hypothetical protein